MEWVRSEAIGHGSFATVNLAFHRKNRAAGGMVTAVKSCAFSNGSGLKKEMEVMRKLGDCPQIIRCMGDGFSSENGLELFNVFMEYASGGSLADLMRKTSSSGLPEPELRRLTASVLKGLKHIHSSGFVHCDIKLDNILLCGKEGKYQAKISDFGLTTEAFGQNRRSGYELRGTPMYMAPESLLRGEYAPPADVWALGCVVAQLASGRPVWRCSGVTELLLRVGVGREVPEIPHGRLSEEGRDFLSRCFVRDPSMRWTAEMLLNHPFVILHHDDVPFFIEGERDTWSCSTVSPTCHFDFANWPSSGSSSSASTVSTTPSSPPPTFRDDFLGQFHSPESSSSARSMAERISLLAGTDQLTWSSSDSWIPVRTEERTALK